MDALAGYRAAFLAGCELRRRPGETPADAPGLDGLRDEPVRLLIRDDRALRALGELPREGTVNVLPAAVRCAERFAGSPAWRAQPLTALLCPELRAVPAPPLPAGLTLRPVGRLAGDDGVALNAFVAAVLRADPRLEDTPAAFAEYLRSLPPPTRLLAAVDAGGTVRATSAFTAFGGFTDVLLVNTDPGWRGRGLGRALTAAALHGAAGAGARAARIDATDAGLPIYRALGCETVSAVTRFSAGR